MNNNNLIVTRKAFRRGRALIEKLEDRILLSAEPLLQQNKPETDDAGLAENLQLVAAPDTRIPTSLKDFELKPVLLNLAQAGGGVSQHPSLSWGVEDSLLDLNESLRNLVIDLGDKNDEVILTEQSDGRMKLSGDSIYDLVFTKPTHLLGLIGGGGIDRIEVQQADLGTASLHIEAERIELGAGSRVVSGGDILLKGWTQLNQSVSVHPPV